MLELLPGMSPSALLIAQPKEALAPGDESAPVRLRVPDDGLLVAMRGSVLAQPYSYRSKISVCVTLGTQPLTESGRGSDFVLMSTIRGARAPWFPLYRPVPRTDIYVSFRNVAYGPTDERLMPSMTVGFLRERDRPAMRELASKVGRFAWAFTARGTVKRAVFPMVPPTRWRSFELAQLEPFEQTGEYKLDFRDRAVLVGIRGSIINSTAPLSSVALQMHDGSRYYTTNGKRAEWVPYANLFSGGQTLLPMLWRMIPRQAVFVRLRNLTGRFIRPSLSVFESRDEDLLGWPGR